MRRYRAAIFKYAILMNVALALFVIWASLVVMRVYFEALNRWAASLPTSEIHGVYEPGQPGPGQLLFACAMISAALVLMLSTIASARRRGSRSYWLRILSFLTILCVIWFETLKFLQFFLDGGAWYRLLQSPTASVSTLIALAASLLLVYNISYRPDLGAPSR
jgi:hypothetical protein